MVRGILHPDKIEKYYSAYNAFDSCLKYVD